jgi:hypothetical protein
MDIKRDPQINSAKWMLRLDDGSAQLFNTEREAQQAMAAAAASEQPIEAELAQQITGEILPQLRELLNTMSAMQVAWQDNGMAETIAHAAIDGNLIVGFSPQTWTQWGETFRLWQEWLETDNPQLGGAKPRAVLMRRYVAQVPS